MVLQMAYRFASLTCPLLTSAPDNNHCEADGMLNTGISASLLPLSLQLPHKEGKDYSVCDLCLNHRHRLFLIILRKWSKGRCSKEDFTKVCILPG